VNRFARACSTAVAVLAGVSPLLWVTASEYRTQRSEQSQSDRRALVQQAEDLVGRGALEELDELVRAVRERHPDDAALGQQLTSILMRGAHSPRFRASLERGSLPAVSGAADPAPPSH